MSFKYAVLGAGRQGIAAAYDLAKFGEAEKVVMVDISRTSAEASAHRVNKLLDKNVALAVQADVGDHDQLSSILEGVNSFISALPYHLNLAITDFAISIGANMCDLGGNTTVVLEQMKKNEEAKAKGITVVPDCGFGPGMNITLATYAMSLLDNPNELYIWDGGLPQNPKSPWNYALTFNIAGLTNEYHGNAYFLRDGEIIKVPCFSDFEEIVFPPPLNRLEAFVTSGGLSTAPWTLKGKLKRLENKTLRYPGHYAQFKAFYQLGLLELEPVQVGDIEVVPRDVLHALLEPKLTYPDIRDVGIIRAKCTGEKKASKAEAIVELMDYYDEQIGFTAMQKITGWHASIVAILAAQGKIPKGVVPVETLSGDIIIDEAKRRGFSIQERVEMVE